MRAFYPPPYLCIFALRSFNANFVVYHYFFLFYTITKLKQRSWITHDLLTLICDAVSQVVAKRKKKTLLHVYDGNNTALYKGITIRVNSRGFLISKNFSKFFFFPVAQCMYFNMYAKRHATVFFFFPLLLCFLCTSPSHRLHSSPIFFRICIAISGSNLFQKYDRWHFTLSVIDKFRSASIHLLPSSPVPCFEKHTLFYSIPRFSSSPVDGNTCFYFYTHSFLHTFYFYFKSIENLYRGGKKEKKNMCRETKDTRTHTYIYIYTYRLKSSVPCFEKGVCFKVTWNFDS